MTGNLHASQTNLSTQLHFDQQCARCNGVLLCDYLADLHCTTRKIFSYKATSSLVRSTLSNHSCTVSSLHCPGFEGIALFPTPSCSLHRGPLLGSTARRGKPYENLLSRQNHQPSASHDKERRGSFTGGPSSPSYGASGLEWYSAESETATAERELTCGNKASQRCAVPACCCMIRTRYVRERLRCT